MAIDTRGFKSIRGRELGISKDGHLISNGKLLVASGVNPNVIVRDFDDFIGDAIDARWSFQEGSDTAATQTITAADGGTLILTTAASAGTYTADGAQFEGQANWKAANGGLSFETRIKTAAVDNVRWFAGFTDQVAALEFPVTLSTTTYTTNASDAVGFLYDTAGTTDTIRCVGVAANTDAAHVDSSVVPVLAVYNRLRVEVDTDGVGTFYIDGLLKARITGCVTAATALVPVICVCPTTAAADVLTADYIEVRMDRA